MSVEIESYINTDLKPSEVKDFPWLICADEQLEEKYCDGQPSGKWMMFFRKTELDSRWLEACNLFRQGKLTGIYQMKVSTFYKNKRASNKKDGVLIFFCGPASNETLMVEYGKNLLQFIDYKPHFGGNMYYKSNEQTTLGTRATGQKENHLYEIGLQKNSD